MQMNDDLNDDLDWVAVLSTTDHLVAREWALVFESRSIPSTLQSSSGQWSVCVPVARRHQAQLEMRAYANENIGKSLEELTLTPIGRGWPGLIGYAVLLIGIGLIATRGWLDFNWYRLGSADAGSIVAGQWWRAITALTLHTDTTHLLGNLGFGAFFGFHIGRYLGTGIGWLAVLLAGTFGNLMNAYLQSPLHRSIGASTAVFAALGILAAYRWQRGFTRNANWRRRVGPLFAALALLAYTGTAGENTDLGAHLLGFLSGLGCGTLLGRIKIPVGLWSNAVAVSVATGLLIGAWSLALFVS